MIEKKIQDEEVIVIKDSTKIIGWLRFGYFWDEHPFMNMLMIDKTFRGRGLGKKLVDFWEKEMKKRDFEFVLTSTLSNEQAQHFYRKIGYEDSGCLLLEGEALKIILRKNLKNICESGALPCTPSN
jgi:ribosomal protein S18 acetylase RimI-like enzyme